MTGTTAMYALLANGVVHLLAVAFAAALVAAGLLVFATLARTRVAPWRSTVDASRAAPISSDDARDVAGSRVLIVGAGARGRELAEAILDHPELRRQIVGFVDDELDLPGVAGIPILGGTREIASLVDRHAIDEIIVAHAPSWQDLLVHQLAASGADERVRVSSTVAMRDAMTVELRLRSIADIPLVALNDRHACRAYHTAKRCFDIAFSLAGLIVSAPAIALMAALVKCTSRGPAFFCQQRVGLHGGEFTIYKLRTMIVDAERDTGPVLADPYDARVTPLGRILRITRLDELPQLFNVLRGDMSMVGPRPERPEFARRYLREIPGYRKRLIVKPGITGLGQVRGRYDTDVHNKLKYDWLYVYRQSVWLDLRILLETVRVVLLRAGQ
ncbi:MAG: sugar transferase [Armatimonadota bacterium]|nr:MAG: sugar transferase [Armatimonadota bacterium]